MCWRRWRNCRRLQAERGRNWRWFRAPGSVRVSEPFSWEGSNMKRKILLPILALGILAFGLAMRAGAPKTETVSYKSGDEMVSAYLALPDGAGKHPAIVVIHEWWGLNDWVKEQAQKYAAQGYVALAGDLYRGKGAGNPNNKQGYRPEAAADAGQRISGFFQKYLH